MQNYKQQSHHKSGETNAIIHRLNSELENGNALITTKESLDINKNRVYSLELELTPRFNDEMRPTDIKSSEGGFSSPKHTADQSVATIAKTDIDIIPQTTQEIIKQAKASDKSIAETKELLQKHNKEIQSIRTEIRKDIATRQKNIEQGYIDIVSSHHTKIGKKADMQQKCI